MTSGLMRPRVAGNKGVQEGRAVWGERGGKVKGQRAAGDRRLVCCEVESCCCAGERLRERAKG